MYIYIYIYTYALYAYLSLSLYIYIYICIHTFAPALSSGNDKANNNIDNNNTITICLIPNMFNPQIIN